jgi:hypothetical protein
LVNEISHNAFKFIRPENDTTEMRIGGCVIVGIKKDSLNLSVNKIRDLA